MPVVLSPRMVQLIEGLDRLGPAPTADGIRRQIEHANLEWDDVDPFVQESPTAYTRASVKRNDAYELLVMTWKPGQGSVPHDHAGSVCCLKVVRGVLTETLFDRAPDSLVDPCRATNLTAGDVTADEGRVVHALHNDCDASVALVTIHVYSPPLPELRRYAPRPARERMLNLFQRSPHREARKVVVVGGGFAGTMTAANLIRLAAENDTPLHVTLIDKQSSIGEGAAYRTNDTRHLLNVPAGRMSAWPDRPSHFLEWAQRRDAKVQASDFLPRRVYGEYLREAFFEAASKAGSHTSVEIIKDEVLTATDHNQGSGDSRWSVSTACGRSMSADAVVVAIGHRPPDDPVKGRWHGSTARYIGDPWASLAITAIPPDQPVIVLGTGLTAIDVIVSLSKQERTAPIYAISRRGLAPTVHASSPVQALDLAETVRSLPGFAEGSLRIRTLCRAVRRLCTKAIAEGQDWRCVIDGLRPHTARLWSALPLDQRKRFLKHLRPFWEIHRHRVAVPISTILVDLVERGKLTFIAGRVESIDATCDNVTAHVRRKSSARLESIAAGHIVNCTGPGTEIDPHRSTLVGTLVRRGCLQVDPLGLGLLTGPHGEGIDASGRLRRDLLIIGTLRKPDLWESTAVPELRVQAADAASAALTALRLEEVGIEG